MYLYYHAATWLTSCLYCLDVNKVLSKLKSDFTHSALMDELLSLKHAVYDDGPGFFEQNHFYKSRNPPPSSLTCGGFQVAKRRRLKEGSVGQKDPILISRWNTKWPGIDPKIQDSENKTAQSGRDSSSLRDGASWKTPLKENSNLQSNLVVPAQPLLNVPNISPCTKRVFLFFKKEKKNRHRVSGNYNL